MEPEEHLIEKYFQTVMNCFTMTNIRCGKGEIDLLAINPKTQERFHVEATVHTTGNKIKKTDIDNFAKKKFDHPDVKKKIKEIFGDGVYRKWLVVWWVRRTDDLVWKEADQHSIEIQFIGDFLDQMVEERRTKGSRDCVLRIIEFMAIHERIRQQTLKKISRREEKRRTVQGILNNTEG